jgi:hypothetical protein
MRGDRLRPSNVLDRREHARVEILEQVTVERHPQGLLVSNATTKRRLGVTRTVSRTMPRKRAQD